jgi:uncharacterized protein
VEGERVTDAAGYEVAVHYDVRIPVRDGLALSANLFLPVAKEPGERFPAILEMIPYRKDDWRYNEDHARLTYLAERGFAGCRLDVRGTGSSPGIALDEYTAQETEDGYDAVEWLAAQPWCNGRLGMWGISYGGFTAIQVAKLRPPHLQAIMPLYATDDRYRDDVHYLGGCKTVSEMAQYALSQVAMNALPPKRAYAGERWEAWWRERLEQTPPWLLTWLRQQTDGPYWRRGSLAPDYEAIDCAIYHISGWTDGYTNAALRMQERCTNAPRKTLIGNWSHTFPDSGYPGPTVDWLDEMVRFFGHWLRDEDDGMMDEPPVTLFRREYTEPEPFPAALNGEWVSAAAFPIPGTTMQRLYLGPDGLQEQPAAEKVTESYPHRPTLGTRAGVTWGAGAPPAGLARDLRPDEALSLTYTSEPLAEALDVIGPSQVVLYLGSSAPVAHAVVRLSDVAPDGTSAWVTGGVLNLTHRQGHDVPESLATGELYAVTVEMKGTAYRFLPGHRLRLSVASAYWPVIFPAPYRATNVLVHGGDCPSRLLLPVVPEGALLAPPAFKTSPAELQPGGSYERVPAQWQVVEDVMAGSVTVRLYEGGETTLPDGTRLAHSEKMAMTGYDAAPEQASLQGEARYALVEAGELIEVDAYSHVVGAVTTFRASIDVQVHRDGELFWQMSWQEDVPRGLL